MNELVLHDVCETIKRNSCNDVHFIHDQLFVYGNIDADITFVLLILRLIILSGNAFEHFD